MSQYALTKEERRGTKGNKDAERNQERNNEEEEAKHALSLTFNGGSAEPAVLGAILKVTNEEKLEVKAEV